MKYRAGYKYQLAEDEVVRTSIRPSDDVMTEYLTLYRNGDLWVKHGYAWDGASGPTYDSKNSMRASLVHDAVYQLMRLKLISRVWRKAIDQDFNRILKEDGMWWPRRRYWLRGVRLFGAASTDPANVKPILEAP